MIEGTVTSYHYYEKVPHKQTPIKTVQYAESTIFCLAMVKKYTFIAAITT